MNTFFQGSAPSFRMALLGALLVFVPLAIQAQDDSPGYPAVAPAAAEAPATALIAQAQVVAPKAAPPTTASTAPARRVHDPLSPPLFVVRNRCTYDYYSEGVRRNTYSEEVAEVAADRVFTKTTNAGGTVTGGLELTPEGNYLAITRRGNRTVYDPIREYLRFPLHVGKAWETSFKQPSNDSRFGPGVRTVSIRAVVVGVQSVTVPAGALMAVKIQMLGHWTNRPDSGGLEQGTVEEDILYSTELGCFIKRTYVVRIDGGPLAANELYELRSYYSRSQDPAASLP